MHSTSLSPVRFITATSLFDGHDAAINIMRRILQSEGAEVVHLGHDRSVQEIVSAAIQEDADGIAISSYQGGHIEFFTYMVELLREKGRSDIKVFGGGGGTITDKEIALLHERGVEKIYSVEDGRLMGLVGMIQDMIQKAQKGFRFAWEEHFPQVLEGKNNSICQTLTWIEKQLEVQEPTELESFRERLQAKRSNVPVLGITGTGGAGKSSLTDELLRRLLEQFPSRKFAVLSVDPSKRKTGGALLGDRIRMNSAFSERVFMRSMATRKAHVSISQAVQDSLLLLKNAGFDLVILETAGIGQSGSEVIDLVELSMYVMTPEFGAPTQLEKIDMLDFADIVALNKSDKAGAEDARKYVAKQMQRNRAAFDKSVDEMPVYACSANQFGNAGVDTLFFALMAQLAQKDPYQDWNPGEPNWRAPVLQSVMPPKRVRYLSEISETVRDYKKQGQKECDLIHRLDGLFRTLQELEPSEIPFGQVFPVEKEKPFAFLQEKYNTLLKKLNPLSVEKIHSLAQTVESYQKETNVYEVRGKQIHVENFSETLSGTKVSKVVVPKTKDWSSLFSWGWLENVPGEFPYTAGVFPYKRQGEDPTRMFAGEGTPERTNRRFHYVSKGHDASRLSTAFDSVTLYGRNPDIRPDVYGKIGNSGVSVATLDDAKRLYSGFDLVNPSTSVSMTINGPAPMILAMFLNTAIDQLVEKKLKESGRWEQAQQKRNEILGSKPPVYRSEELPEGHNGQGLGLLGVSGDQLVSAEEYKQIKAEALAQVRGTVQADILKEDQAQNTCIFSTEFALKMMGDIQEYFIEHDVRNFYSVSVSGYHIAEAGANPISQLAFTLANGFTLAEYYVSRGMNIDDFARNFSFFFSNGIDPEYSVIGRVSRRIWAIAMKEMYHANARSQQLKYHIQTSGRSLHAQEMTFNDIRTTLQAFYALADNCNSLHTNAFDEAITTPTESSVRQALAIQLILNREFGLLKNENPLQGSYLIEELTELVEEAVLEEFDRITSRGGVLGAMELMYQRSKIQEESMHYETQKHDGKYPIIGVNTFLNPQSSTGVAEIEMARSSEEEKQHQIEGLRDFHQLNQSKSAASLAKLKKSAIEGGNVFSELMETVKVCSLGQITQALFEVGGQYRRNM